MSAPWLWLVCVWAVLAVVFAGLWLYCHRIKNASHVDVAWAFAIGVGAILGAFMLEGMFQRRLWVAVLGAVWAFRLAWHLLRRVHGKPEDGRYAHMRAYFGGKAPLAFFIFFQMQAFFVVLFLAPMVAAMTYSGPFDWRLPAGIMIWLVAMGGEFLADRQLDHFKADPTNQGKVCKQGLWRYSRHPNYFFEWLHWFAYLVIGGTLSTAIGYAALAGPIVMLVFLVFVTGIPYTEMRAVQSKGEAYRQYQRETSAFFPWFPKTKTT